jgi:hypothetical protein
MNIAGLRSIGSAMLLVLLAGCPLCEQLFIDSWGEWKVSYPAYESVPESAGSP